MGASHDEVDSRNVLSVALRCTALLAGDGLGHELPGTPGWVVKRSAGAAPSDAAVLSTWHQPCAVYAARAADDAGTWVGKPVRLGAHALSPTDTSSNDLEAMHAGGKAGALVKNSPFFPICGPPASVQRSLCHPSLCRPVVNSVPSCSMHVCSVPSDQIRGRRRGIGQQSVEVFPCSRRTTGDPGSSGVLLLLCP